MLNEDRLLADLCAMGLATWKDSVLPTVRNHLRKGVHGHLPRWQEILTALPSSNNVRELLLELAPWRKGPFELNGIHIEAEWRSDLKWNRFSDHIEPLTNRLVLDVGAGNGWYALRMREAGATWVIGVDPTLLFVAQFEALRILTGATGIHILPIGIESLPTDCHTFDTTFSMGVLYHQRNPEEHLSQLKGTLRRGGQLVLETLVYPGDDHKIIEPEHRYARMRNVWHLPTVPTLLDWVSDAGFENIDLVNVTTTTIEEQRTTDWMPYESLAAALDPNDPGTTVEGMPAPVRAILTANFP